MRGSSDELALYTALGRRIARARKTVRPKSLSQQQLAERAGLTRGSIANIERGHQHPPLETLFRLARALEVEVQVLLPSMAEVGAEDLESRALTTQDEAPLEMLGLKGSMTEDWLKRVKARAPIEQGGVND